MAKAIITQTGDIVNFSSLTVIYNKKERDSITGKDHFYLVGETVTGSEWRLGEFSSFEDAFDAKADLASWLCCEAFSTFEVPDPDDDTGE